MPLLGLLGLVTIPVAAVSRVAGGDGTDGIFQKVVHTMVVSKLLFLRALFPYK